ncbi:MAG: hypothetical protein LBR37_00215 [Erysipelotrichaceae bacterium]|nr:hypothetical protein [Erysipelotrichaceae bacterium]
MELFHQIKAGTEQEILNSLYEPKCRNCGGLVENGVCLYCGTRGELIGNDQTFVARGKRK